MSFFTPKPAGNKVVPTQTLPVATPSAGIPVTEHKGETKGGSKTAPVESLRLDEIPQFPTEKNFSDWNKKLAECHRLSIYDPLLNRLKLNCIKSILEKNTTVIFKAKTVKFTRLNFSAPHIVDDFTKLIEADLITHLIFNDTNLQKDDLLTKFIAVIKKCPSMQNIEFIGDSPLSTDESIAFLKVLQATNSQIKFIRAAKVNDFDKEAFAKFREEYPKLKAIAFNINGEYFADIPPTNTCPCCAVM